VVWSWLAGDGDVGGRGGGCGGGECGWVDVSTPPVRCDWGWDGMGRDGTGWDGMGWDGADENRLAAVYNAGYFRMSTWIPCVWGVINTLVLILSSFSLQGAL